MEQIRFLLRYRSATRASCELNNPALSADPFAAGDNPPPMPLLSKESAVFYAKPDHAIS
jgi:hypothetical protein